MEIISLPHLPQQPLRVCLFKDVRNAAFLRQQLIEGNRDFENAFLDASVLLSRNHVLAACFRAINDELNGRLKSRNVHSEIVFALSPNNNVSLQPGVSGDLIPLEAYVASGANGYLDRRVFSAVWRFPGLQEYTCHQGRWRCCPSGVAFETECPRRDDGFYRRYTLNDE